MQGGAAPEDEPAVPFPLPFCSADLIHRNRRWCPCGAMGIVVEWSGMGRGYDGAGAGRNEMGGVEWDQARKLDLFSLS